MKNDTTTWLGWFLIICSAMVTMGDMYLSTKPEYTFELIGWQVLSVVGAGLVLVVLPEDIMIDMIKKTWAAVIKWKFKK